MVKDKSKETEELADDDTRGNSVLMVERVGIFDGLSSIYKVPKTGTTVDYRTSEEPDNLFTKGWWIFDHVNNNYQAGIGYVLDMSYFNRHARVYGNPCIVSGGPGLQLPWRPDSVPSLVTVANHDTHYRIPNSSDFQVGTSDWSIVLVIYPRSFGKVNSVTNNVIELENREIDPDIQHINCGNHASLWSQSLSKFTISFWVRFNSLDGDSNEYLVSHGRMGTNSSFSVRLLRDEDNKIDFSIVNSAGTVFDAESDDSMETDTWYHIVCTQDNSLGGGTNMKIYIDGIQQVGNLGGFVSTINLSADLLIGDTDAQESPDIKVKDFRFWGPATVLTQQQITDLFAGNDLAVPTADYHLTMDEGEGNPVANSSQTATLVNGAHWNISESYTHKILRNQIYCSKRDDSSNKYTIWVETDGVLYVHIKKGGSDFKMKMNSAMSINTWYWIVVTFDDPGNTIKIWRNAVDVGTTTTTGGELNQNLGSAYNDLFLLSSNQHANLADCAIYLFGRYADVYTSGEISNLFNNKATITDLTGAQVAVTEFAMVQE